MTHRIRALILITLVAAAGIGILLLIMTRLSAPAATAPAPTSVPAAAETAPTPAVTIPPTELPEDAVAVVNGQTIARQAWQKAVRVDVLMSHLAGQPAPSAEETLDRLVGEILILEAVPSAPTPASETVDRRLSELIAGWGRTGADVDQALASAGLTRSDLLDRVSRLMQVENALGQLAAQTGNLDDWLASARAQAEIGLYQPLVAQSLAPTVTPSPSLPITPSPTPPPTATPTPPPPDLPTGPNPQNLAPDFTLPTLSGEPLTLSSLRGRPVLINFWATWCPPCRVELPALQDAYNRYGDRIGFVAVDVKEDRATVEPFVRQMGLTFPIALDSTGQVSGQLYRVLGIPTTVFIDAQGVVAARHVGPLTPTAIDDYLAPLLEDSAPATVAPAESSAAENLAPEFSLTAASGETISLQDYRGQSTVVLVFYRGYTWGICRQQVAGLQAAYPEFKTRGAEILALAVQSQSDARQMVQATGATFPILADPDHAVADAYGVYNLLGDAVAAPSVFIIDKTGQIVWSYIGQNAADRPSAEAILEHLP